MNVFTKVTKFSADQTHIRYYFDDEKTPRINMSFAEFFGKGGKYTPPFSPPLAYFDTLGLQWNEGPGTFANMYYPLPFKKRLKIAAYNPPGLKWYEGTWFQYTYLKYPPARRSRLGRAGGSIRRRCDGNSSGSGKTRSHRWPARRIRRRSRFCEVRQRRPSTFPARAPSRYTLRLGLAPWSADTFYHTRIRITLDDLPGPSVDMSLASFFGGGGDTIGVAGRVRQDLPDAAFRLRRQDPAVPLLLAHALLVAGEDRAGERQQVGYRRDQAGGVLRARRDPAFAAGSAADISAAKRTIDISPDNALWSHAFQTRGHGKVDGHR